MRALLIEHGFHRAALSAARALRAAGWAVGVGSRRPGLAGWSRATGRVHPVAAPSGDLGAFVGEVQAALDAGGYDVVFGVGDAEALALSLVREQLTAVIPYPPHETVVRALDKVEMQAAAERAGFATPRTVEATEEALAQWRGPAFVKARSHSAPGRADRALHVPTRRGEDRGEIARLVADVREMGAEPVLQEVVDGPLRAHVTVVGHDGRPAARLLQEATALYPPRAGITVRGRTLEIDEVVAARVEAMLADLGWFGLAELQYLTGPDGRAHVIDLNGRFYGSLALALGAGVNLPAVWGALALGGSAEAVVDGRPGVLYQWLEGDLRRARVERRGGLLRDVAGCLVAAPGRVHSIWSVRDPLPAVRYAAHLAARRAVRGAS